MPGITILAEVRLTLQTRIPSRLPDTRLLLKLFLYSRNSQFLEARGFSLSWFTMRALTRRWMQV